MHAPWSGLARYRDLGLLVLRVGIGAAFVLHGWPKLMGGPERWEAVGGAMGNLGVTFAPTFWGFMAAAAETGGGALVALGLMFRPACALLAFTMLVATIKHVQAGDAFGRWSHAAESMILFLGLLLVGPGRHSVDERL